MAILRSAELCTCESTERQDVEHREGVFDTGSTRASTEIRGDHGNDIAALKWSRLSSPAG